MFSDVMTFGEFVDLVFTASIFLLTVAVVVLYMEKNRHAE